MKEATVPEANSGNHHPATGNGSSETKNPKAGAPKKAAAKASPGAKSSGKSRSVAPRKASSARKPRPASAGKKKTAGSGAFSDEEIRTRAYFISQWRLQNVVPGDSAHDWLEAVRQLQDEAGHRSDNSARSETR
ncbi:MAG: hypothetical protein ABI540_04910 [Spartobacteria bacterium]